MGLHSLAKRASMLDDLLVSKPSEGKYLSSYPELVHLPYRERKTIPPAPPTRSVPNMWKARSMASSVMSSIWSAENSSQAGSSGIMLRPPTRQTATTEQMRRRRSYTSRQIQDNMLRDRRTGQKQNTDISERSSFESEDSDSRAATSQHPTLTFLKKVPSHKRKRVLLAILLVVVLAIALGLTGGLVAAKKKRNNGIGSTCSKTCLNGGIAKGDEESCTCECNGTFVGTFCHLGEHLS